MRYRSRIQKLQKIVFANDRLRGARQTLWWDPLDPVSTQLALKQTFDVPHTQRKYTIRILGKPPEHVIRGLAKKILPCQENLKDLSDEELDSCIERFQKACHEATNESRRKLGLRPVQWDWSIKSVGSEFNNIMTEVSD